MIASSFIVIISIKIRSNYNNDNLATVIKTTNKHVSEIHFPAITICTKHRLNYRKFRAAAKIFYPEALHSPAEFKRFTEVARFLENVLSKDEPTPYISPKISALKRLNKINIKNFLEFMVIKCEDFISNCWWLKKEVSCCDIFRMQRTQMGICYSFNSMSADQLQNSTVIILYKIRYMFIK